MPDHLHVVFLLAGSDPLSEVMGSFSKFTARRINKVLQRSGQFWQKGYYDRMVRDDDELFRQLAYIIENPVRGGFVASASEWPWSGIYPDW